MIKKIHINSIILLATLTSGSLAFAQQPEEVDVNAAAEVMFQNKDNSFYPIFDDSRLLKGYIQKYQQVPKDVLIEMIKDDTLTSFKTAAAIRAFNESFISEVVSREKKFVEKYLLQRLKKTDSPFVQVEIMHALCKLDRYKYFKSMVPELISKLGHYNDAVNEIAFYALKSLLIDNGSNRPREARIVFTMLRKVLFLSRNRIANIKIPDERLKQKLQLIKWSIKVLGTQQLKKLPKEVIDLL